MAIQKKKIPEYFHKHTIIDELQKIKKEKQNADEEYLKYLNDYENEIQKYSVDLLEDIVIGDNQAFDDFLKIKDIRNFIYYYAYHINKYHKFRFHNETIVHEIKVQIYNHIIRNYRIYYEPHEFSLLINSMRKWLKLKVNESIKIVFMPKNDERLNQSFLDAECEDSDDFVVRDLMERYLDEEEKQVFELRFFDNMGYVEIGEEMGFSKDTAQRRYNKCLEKLKEYL